MIRFRQLDDVGLLRSDRSVASCTIVAGTWGRAGGTWRRPTDHVECPLGQSHIHRGPSGWQSVGDTPHPSVMLLPPGLTVPGRYICKAGIRK